MSPDEAALLATIFATPDDDLPRLVYADWLDEQGTEASAARAEFIRLQCHRERQAAADPSQSGISWREYELLLEWGLHWRDELPVGLRRSVIFRRGFINRIRCDATELFRAWRNDVPLPPIERLEITITHVQIDWLDLGRPAQMPPLRHLTLNCVSPVAEEALQLLTHHGPHSHLESLTIHDRSFLDTALTWLTPEPAFPNLKHLDLSFCGLSEAAADALMDSEWVSRLASLNLSGNVFENETSLRLQSIFGARVLL